jgi:hypothetical protein
VLDLTIGRANDDDADAIADMIAAIEPSSRDGAEADARRVGPAERERELADDPADGLARSG